MTQINFRLLMCATAIVCTGHAVRAQQPVLLQDVVPGSGYSDPNHAITLPSGAFYFNACTQDPRVGPCGMSVFYSAGLGTGAQNIMPGFMPRYSLQYNGRTVVEVDGSLYFTNAGGALDYIASASGFYRVDSKPIIVGGRMYFSGHDLAHGQELWVSDGTDIGTHMVRDIMPGLPGGVGGYLYQEASPFTTLDGQRVLFLATDTAAYTQWWSSDGTAAGTYPVSDITTAGAPGSRVSGLSLLQSAYAGTYAVPFTHIANGQLYFVVTAAGSGTSQRTATLWRLNGTTGGAQPVKTLTTTASSGAPSMSHEWVFFGIGNSFVFTAPSNDGVELWVSDGTAAGTSLLKDVYPGWQSGTPMGFQAINGGAVFVARGAGNPYNYQLWFTNGTAAGTVLLKDFPSAPSGAAQPQASIIHEPKDFTRIGGKIYFSAYTTAAGNELWETDGTATGTKTVSDIYAGNFNSWPLDICAASGQLYFTAANAQWGTAAWRYDPLNNQIHHVAPVGSTVVSAAKRLYKISETQIFINAMYDTTVGLEPYVLAVNTPTMVPTMQLSTAGISPNPTTGVITISAAAAGTAYTVTSLLGQEFQRGTILTSTHSLSLASLPSGTYLLTLTAPDGRRATGRVVRQ